MKRRIPQIVRDDVNRKLAEISAEYRSIGQPITDSGELIVNEDLQLITPINLWNPHAGTVSARVVDAVWCRISDQ